MTSSSFTTYCLHTKAVKPTQTDPDGMMTAVLQLIVITIGRIINNPSINFTRLLTAAAIV
jgi:hypothetical protein